MVGAAVVGAAVMGAAVVGASVVGAAVVAGGAEVVGIRVKKTQLADDFRTRLTLRTAEASAAGNSSYTVEAP